VYELFKVLTLKFDRLNYLKLGLFIAQLLVHLNLAIWLIWFVLAFGELGLISLILVNF
jgi:hypothetical protein